MKKTIAVWSILLLCLLLTTSAQPSLGATKEGSWEYGKEYTLGGSTATVTRSLAVNQGDVVTVKITNIVAKASFAVGADLIYINSSDDAVMSSSIIDVSSAGSYSFWFTCACTQQFYLGFYLTDQGPPYPKPYMTVNITKVNGTDQKAEDILALKQNVTALNQSLTNLSAWANATFSSLNMTLATLNSTLSYLASAFLENMSIVSDALEDLQNYSTYLNTSIGELNASILAMIDGINTVIDDLHNNLSAQFQNITVLWENITNLWTGLSSLGAQETTDYDNLKAQLAALNTSLLEANAALRALMETNDTALRGLLDANNASLSGDLLDLTERLAALRGEVQNISFPEPEQYNDTLLWREIARLNATPPVTIVQANNTTVVNTTEVYPTTFVNRTETQSFGSNGVIAGAITGIATGLVVSGGGLVYLDRRLKRRYGGMVASPEGEG